MQHMDEDGHQHRQQHQARRVRPVTEQRWVGGQGEQGWHIKSENSVIFGRKRGRASMSLSLWKVLLYGMRYLVGHYIVARMPPISLKSFQLALGRSAAPP